MSRRLARANMMTNKSPKTTKIINQDRTSNQPAQNSNLADQRLKVSLSKLILRRKDV